MTATMTKSDLAAEVAGLRAELEELRRQLAGEVRTRRLVVVDEDGDERIFTRCDEHGTGLSLYAPEGSLGHTVSVHLSAETDVELVDDCVYGDLAQVQCATGDDSFALLKHSQRPSDAVWAHGETDGIGSVELFSKPAGRDLRVLELRGGGVQQVDVARQPVGYRPMQSLPPVIAVD